MTVTMVNAQPNDAHPATIRVAVLCAILTESIHAIAAEEKNPARKSRLMRAAIDTAALFDLVRNTLSAREPLIKEEA